MIQCSHSNPLYRQLNVSTCSRRLQHVASAPIFTEIKCSFQLRIPSITPNEASVRALSRLTDMKHINAAFFQTESGALSLVILRGTRPTERQLSLPRAHKAN
jgi:hypothetical protein